MPVIEHDFSRFEPEQITKAVDKVLAKEAKKTHKVATQIKPVVTDVISVKLGYGIMQVMQLDDEGVCREWGLVIDARKKSFIIVWATRKDLINFSNACADRISSQYDQPLWYMSSAKATVAKIEQALKGAK